MRVPNPDNNRLMKLVMVQATVLVEVCVTRCDRCGEERPNAVRTGETETDREWVGKVRAEELPAGWRRLDVGYRSGEFCGGCAEIVEHEYAVFASRAGLPPR